MKQTTLCYVVKDGQVLLAMKKRGFATGKWNGPGGKVEAGESVEQACRREVKEEVGIELENLEQRGVIEFRFPEKPEWDQVCSIFVATSFEGEPAESEEMRPAWFRFDDMPLADMWEDDSIWLSGVLDGGKVNMRFFFDERGKMWRFEEM
ncbi:8-oxo-dGTP diphosphatase [Candidatus Uhrbacteria bacterium]|nr:8-oxo-dGTP diphosphatase [Candidatus Uhrbacteria bacterium]